MSNGFRVDLLFVTEGHWPKRQHHVARVVHAPNFLLEAGRGRRDANLAVAVYLNRRAHYPRGANTGGKRFRLRSLCANANRVRFASNASIADINIVVTRREVEASVTAQCDVAAAGCVAKERFVTVTGIVAAGYVKSDGLKTGAGVAGASGVGNERLKTNGHIAAVEGGAVKRLKTDGDVMAADGVAIERLRADGRAAETGCMAIERIKTYRRVVGAGCEAEKRVIALGGVLVRIASVRWWVNGSHCGRKRKADEHHRDEEKTEPQRRPAD